MLPKYIGKIEGIGKIIDISLNDKLVDNLGKNIYFHVKTNNDNEFKEVIVFTKYTSKKDFNIDSLIKKLKGKEISFKGYCWDMHPSLPYYIQAKIKLL